MDRPGGRGNWRHRQDRRDNGQGQRGAHHQGGARRPPRQGEPQHYEDNRREYNENGHGNGDYNDNRERQGHRNNNQNRHDNVRQRTMGFRYIESLLQNDDLNDIIFKLSNDRNGFKTLLDDSNISHDLIVLLIKLVWKVCDSTFQEVKIAILHSVLASKFIDKLILYITQINNQNQREKYKNKHFWNDPDEFWNNLINVSRAVQEIIPNTGCEPIRKILKTMTVFFPAIELTHSMHISDSIKASTASLLEIVERIEDIEVKKEIKRVKVMDNEDEPPPNDFREIEIIPSAQEVVSEISPFLRANVTEKAYKSIDDYLDIQFRLLREDFVTPLRRGICTFLRNQQKPKQDWKKLDDIKIYNKIRFLNVETVNECNCYKIQFDFTKKKKNFTYENSRRFMFGSLVCFTSDNFKTLLFGKIVGRDIKLLETGMLIIGFQEDVIINYEVDYLMVESSVYFEPYYQVLGVLKRMHLEEFPMEKYIIRVETDSNPPNYLMKIDPVFYDVEGTRFWPLNFPVEKKFYGLNESQLTAFKAALTEEFCIVQGPPGTGKTFLGLKIAHTLLQNRHAWYNKTPILVICYTNHALDQFLEGLLPVTDNILRVGGQSKNENMKKYNLNSKRRTQSHQAAVHQKRREVRDYMENIRTLSDNLNQIAANESILSFSSFATIDDSYQDSIFAQTSRDVHIKWLMEGKNERVQRARRIVQREAAEGIENLEIADGENERPEDLNEGDNREQADWEDDVLDNLQIRGNRPLITLQQLRDKLHSLNVNHRELDRYEENLETMLQREKIQLEIWDTESDYNYIGYQLDQYQNNPQYRRRPQHIDLKNPSNMRPADRWQLYFYWLDLYTARLRRQYEECGNRFREVFRVYNQMRDMEDTQLMKASLVVGMTTTGAARLQSSLQALRSPIVIVEEAAEVLEAHIVAALTNFCQHLILIGDHQQLKPSAADYNIEKHYKLGISLFERMVNNNIQCHTLNVQHRMRPEISQLVSEIYPSLQDHESTLQRPPILGIEKCLYFIDHQEQEALCQDASKKNVHEAIFLIALARHLILNGYKPEQITILAAYLGQMFEMVREKRKDNNRMLLQDVRISVLDNYQGEECDIILLSLVRSNAENNAGFLRIQNRVCVALSRARDGFYIMGNMALLCRANSENGIWDYVKKTLSNQNAIGPFLTLKCQIHPYRFTQVSKSDDFVKLSEGGCDLMCEAHIHCGHICKRLCHVQDRDHVLYKCNERCTKLLCNDPLHICRKLCYQECGPCDYPVLRQLDCGHTVEIACHIDPSQHRCTRLVQTKLPCNHEAKKPCSIDPEIFRCPHPCDTRVEPCGHACDRSCHIRVDPDHLQYKCKQECAKTRIGCKETENPHICTKMCFQDCDECIIGVKKFRRCGHVFTLACKTDVESVECKKPCKKTLDCGHPCKSKCCEPCGPCQVLVEKTIPECQHDVKIKCHETPARQHCKSRMCPRLLPCGHSCKKPCKAVCTNQCREIVDCNIRTPCEHYLTKIQCCIQNTYEPELLLKHCSQPCGATLECKHKCLGTCGECLQGRLHKRCGEKCGVPLVCNHACPVPCREACKPCTKQCEMKCKHSKCKKKCGEPCTACKSKCERRCEHQKCSKPCGDICEVPPCSERCKKLLECGHPCVGFCKDPCPTLCRICNNEELTTIFFGTEDEEDAIFVMLNDCKHIFESEGLNNWIIGDDNEIKFKVCPRCKTNITTTERYSEYVKRAMRDVIAVKQKFYGSSQDNDSLRIELLRELEELKMSCNVSLIAACDPLDNMFTILNERLQPIRNQRRQAINNMELIAIKSKIQTLTYIINTLGNIEVRCTREDPPIKHLNIILQVLLRAEDHVTNQEIEDVQLEITRLNRIVQFEKIKRSDQFQYAQAESVVKHLIKNIEHIVFSPKRYSILFDNALKSNLNELKTKVASTLTISDTERMQIVNAIGLSKGHWYKCPNGHPYAIGDCGGANQISTCHCGAQIGGQNHRLLSDNQLASEMDGATHSAWPGTLH